MVERWMQEMQEMKETQEQISQLVHQTRDARQLQPVPPPPAKMQTKLKDRVVKNIDTLASMVFEEVLADTVGVLEAVEQQDRMLKSLDTLNEQQALLQHTLAKVKTHESDIISKVSSVCQFAGFLGLLFGLPHQCIRKAVPAPEHARDCMQGLIVEDKGVNAGIR